MSAMATRRRHFLTSLAGAFAATRLRAQEPYVPKQSDRPETITGDEPGFTPIFDGKTLNKWEGDPKYWRVENGCLVGEITPATVIKSNTFIIWRGGARRFQAQGRLPHHLAGNSGIAIRRRRARHGDSQQVRHARLRGRYRRSKPVHRPEL